VLVSAGRQVGKCRRVCQARVDFEGSTNATYGGNASAGLLRRLHAVGTSEGREIVVVVVVVVASKSRAVPTLSAHVVATSMGGIVGLQCGGHPIIVETWCVVALGVVVGGIQTSGQMGREGIKLTRRLAVQSLRSMALRIGRATLGPIIVIHVRVLKTHRGGDESCNSNSGDGGETR